MPSVVDPATANSFFTWASLTTFQGTTLATYLAPNAVGRLFPGVGPLARLRIAFVVAMLLSLGVALIATDPGIGKWVVALFNGLLVFSAATGANQGSSPGGGGGAGYAAPIGRRFRLTWL